MHSEKLVSSKENPFSKVIKTMQSLGIHMNFDGNQRNYMVNDYGDEMYVDTINYSRWDTDQKNAVIAYMESAGFSPSEINKVSAYIDRLLLFNSVK